MARYHWHLVDLNSTCAHGDLQFPGSLKVELYDLNCRT